MALGHRCHGEVPPDYIILVYLFIEEVTGDSETQLYTASVKLITRAIY